MAMGGVRSRSGIDGMIDQVPSLGAVFVLFRNATAANECERAEVVNDGQREFYELAADIDIDSLTLTRNKPPHRLFPSNIRGLPDSLSQDRMHVTVPIQLQGRLRAKAVRTVGNFEGPSSRSIVPAPEKSTLLLKCGY